jgi:hypothetical protein
MLIALSLSLLTLLQGAPSKKPPAAAPLVLEGVWIGDEVVDVGSRHPTITFSKDGGTLAYEDATGGTGTFKMRLQALSVQGAQVRFAVPGGGKLRHWSGRWDGKKIAGTIAADASGTPQVGTFELRRPVYEDAPRRSSGSSDSGVAAPAAPAAGESAGGEAASAPVTSQIESQREEGKQRLEKRLSQISDQASQLLTSIGEWQSSCRQGGTPLYDQPAADCDGMIREIGRLAIAVGNGLEQAEDEARRSWVEPGVVRQLRADYGLESSKWDELSSRVRQAQAEWERRQR